MTHPISTPARLTDLVSYQQGSVVSRVLFRDEAGVVTLFAFAEGEGLSEHSTPHEATVLVLEGRVRIDVGGTTHDVSEGEMLHLPASVPHALRGGEPFKMLLTLFKRAGRD